MTPEPPYDRAFWLAELARLAARVKSRARWARAARKAGRTELFDALASDVWDTCDTIADIRDNADDVIPEARRAYRNAEATKMRLTS